MTSNEEVVPNLPPIGSKNGLQQIIDEVRQLITKQMNKGMTISQVSTVFGVTYKAVSKIYRIYRNTGQRVKKRKGGNRRPLLDTDMKNFLCLNRIVIES